MLNNAFSYIFKDNRIINKSVLCFIFMFIGLFCKFAIKFNAHSTENLNKIIILAIISLIIKTIIDGYKICNISVILNKNDNYVLPYINLKQNFKVGLKFVLAKLIFSMFCYFFICGFSLLIGLSIIFNSRLITSIFLILAIVTCITYSLYLLIFNIGFTNLYVKNPNYFIFFKIKELILEIKKSPKIYFKSLLLYVFFTLTSVALLCTISKLDKIIILTILPLYSVFIVYTFFVENHLTAKCLNT